MSPQIRPSLKWLDRPLFSMDGHAIGTIRVINYKNKSHPDRIYLWIGPAREDGVLVPTAELVVRKGKVTWKHYYKMWADGMAIYR
jgi:hypothetical protein